jgi:hypothetical protein
MADFATNYMGLSLKNPIVAGSSGLTNKILTPKQRSISGIIPA